MTKMTIKSYHEEVERLKKELEANQILLNNARQFALTAEQRLMEQHKDFMFYKGVINNLSTALSKGSK